MFFNFSYNIMASTAQSFVDTFLGTFSPKTYDALRLSFYAFMIISTHMGSAFLFQKIFKTPYTRTNSKLGLNGEVKADYFSNLIGLSLFIYFFCYLISLATDNQDKINQQDPPQNVMPWHQPVKISVINVLTSVFTTLVIILSSFLVTTIIESCQLIAVVILAVFFSRVSPRFRVKKRQIAIAIALCLGVMAYVLFDQHQEENKENKPLGWLSGILMVIILFLYALKPELFAQIRDKYEVSTSFVTLQVSKYTFILLLIVSVVSLQFWQMCVFFWEHDRILLDLSLAALLNAVGLIFCFRTCLQYKQHVMPTIGAVRKLFSALLSSFYFHHNVNGFQYGGVVLVFGALFMDIFLNIQDQHEISNQKFQQNEVGWKEKDEIKLEQQNI